MSQMMETPVIPLVDALNSLPGIMTLESCSGHTDKFIDRKPMAPFITFTVDEFESGVHSISLISVAASMFEWVVICSPLFKVNLRTKEIPAVWQSRKITSCFCLTPHRAISNKPFISYPFYTLSSVECAGEEQNKIKEIAEFITENRDKFDFVIADYM